MKHVHPRLEPQPGWPALDAIARRFEFAAWPQAHVHPSWLAALASATGVPVAGQWGPGAGPAALAVAQALLAEAGAPPGQRVPVDQLPRWALLPREGLHRHLAAAGAINLLPELRAAVHGPALRHWDTLLGPELRRGTLRWCSRHLRAEAPAHARALRTPAQAAARSAEGWQAFCLAMSLAALDELGDAVAARMRLAWPHALRHTPALPLDSAALRWLQACLKVAEVMREDLAREAALPAPDAAAGAPAAGARA